MNYWIHFKNKSCLTISEVEHGQIMDRIDNLSVERLSVSWAKFGDGRVVIVNFAEVTCIEPYYIETTK